MRARSPEEPECPCASFSAAGCTGRAASALLTEPGTEEFVAGARELYRQWDSRSTNPAVSPHFTHLPAAVMEAGSLWFEVALDGIVLYDRSGSMRRFLTSIRGAIADGRLRRRYAHGHPYWVKEERGAHAE